MYIALSEDELREAQASSGLQSSLRLAERVFEHQKENELARADAFKTDFKDPESLVPLWGNQGHKNDTEYQVLREKGKYITTCTDYKYLA